VRVIVIESDVALFIKTVLVIVGALLPIVNPVGSAPFFLALTEGADRPTRHALSATVAINSFLLVAGSLILGHFVLRLFGLSIPVVQFAGGLVLCLLGARMLSTDASAEPQAKNGNDATAIARAFYPLTLPLTVDPGSISVAITIGANHPRQLGSTLVTVAAGIVGLAIIATSIWGCYHYAERVSKWLGQSRMMVVLRHSAFVMLCIGVNIAWNGTKGLLDEVTIKTAQAAASPMPNVARGR
jgi:multiple antibiotic resistance protein